MSTDRGKYMDAITALERLVTNSRQLSESEWHEVGTLLVKLGETALDRSRPATPQPRIGNTGVGICSTNCTMFALHCDTTKSGRCLSGEGHPTRAGVPCFPWVEHFVNEHPGKEQRP